MRTPIALITGYLGSGKTTLLRRIVEKTGRKLAILMNEFGEIAIDSRVVQGKNIRMAELAGGCVCCSLIGEFEAAVQEILETVGPEMIVVETTGVAEPDALAFDIQDSLPQLRLDGIITVVDADSMVRFPQLGHTGRTQIEVADILLLNKVDLLEPGRLQQVEESLRGLNDTATLFRTRYCEMDTDLLFGLEVERRVLSVVEGHLEPTDHSHPEIGWFSFSSDKALERERFEEIARELPREVYRAKGFVRVPEGSFLFNFVAGRWEMEAFEAEGTRLVFIGTGLEGVKEEILGRLKGCEG